MTRFKCFLGNILETWLYKVLIPLNIIYAQKEPFLRLGNINVSKMFPVWKHLFIVKSSSCEKCFHRVSSVETCFQ